MSKKSRLFSLMLAIVVIPSFALWFWFRGPVAYSDVPVTSEVGWWPYQDDIKITGISAEAVNPDLGLSLFYDRSHFLIRCHIKGLIRHGVSKDEKLKIVEVQLTGRILSHATAQNNYESSAEILLVPVLAPSDDNKYNGEEIPFDLKAEHVFSAMDWGKNNYIVRCGDMTATVTVSVAK